MHGFHRTRIVLSKKWMEKRVYQDVLDKPPTQYQLVPSKKMEDVLWLFEVTESECPDFRIGLQLLSICWLMGKIYFEEILLGFG